MITTRDQLISALGNNSSRLILDKANLAGQAAGTFVSMWKATGQPAVGSTPAGAATCNNTTLGAVGFAQQTAPATSYIGYLEYASSNALSTLEIHDRLAHMGGLNGTVTTAQTVGIALNSLAGTDNLTARIGGADYSDVQWWIEWYVATGATATNATVNVTYNDGSTGDLTAIPLAASRPAGFMQPINSFVPPAAAGKFIRGVNSVMLSASTGTAGSFGVTATRIRGGVSTVAANFKQSCDWAGLGLPEVKNSACLFPIVLTGTTSSGTVRGTGKIVHG